jgi:cell division protein FtsI/penicillin-binding protein 2
MKKLTLMLLMLILMLAVGLHPPQASSSAAGQKSRQSPSASARTGSKTKQSSARTTPAKKTSASRTSQQKKAALARQRARSRALAKADAALKKAGQDAIARDELRGEDPDVRRAMLEALGDHAGTVVAMDPNTGRVYSIVNQEWALRKGFKPCSTIKLVVSIAGLKEGLIDPNALVPLGGRSVALDLTEALAHSNNQYFDLVGAELGRAKVLSYARECGLGSRTGINLPREFSGTLPSEKAKSKRRIPGASPQADLTVGLMASHGDGFELTALQLAVLTSAIINGGYLYQPQVVKPDADPKEFQPILVRQLNITDEQRTAIIAGMMGAVEYGTAKLAYDPVVQVAGKTGSCRGQSLSLGLFASYATVQKPRMVIVVITNEREGRGSMAAQIAGRAYQRLASRLLERPATDISGTSQADKTKPSALGIAAGSRP